MYVARILYPVEVLGPGKRIGIWFAGCVHHCEGCSNPELWQQEEKWRTDCATVMRLVNTIAQNKQVDGFTITGGDPFLQAEALRELLPHLATISKDILVYTGYMYEELALQHQDILEQIAVLIDGPYIASQNHGQFLRGSDNQRIFYKNDAVRSKYERYIMEMQGTVQNFSTRDGIISVGIHLPDYAQTLRSKAAKKGLEAK